MFKRSEIGVKCSCGVPETVCRESGFKRYLVPAGYYGGLYQDNGYYTAEWQTLECQQCKRQREDFHVWKWHSNGDMTFVDAVLHDDSKLRKYPDIKRAILNMMEV